MKLSKSIPHVPVMDNLNTLFRLSIVFICFVIVYTFISHQSVEESMGERLLYNFFYFYMFFFCAVTPLMILSSFFGKISAFKRLFFYLIIVNVSTIATYLFLNETAVDLEHLGFNGLYYVAINTNLVFFIYLMYFDWHKKNHDPDTLRIKLTALQERIRPHFLFNTLNSVLMLIYTDPSKAERAILDLSVLIRDSMIEPGSEYTRVLSQEVELVNKYLAIEKIRLGDRMSYGIHLDEDCKDALIPQLTIQPVVENAVVHGIGVLESGGFIDLTIKKTGDEIVVRCANSNGESAGRHYPRANPHVGNGFALKNLSKRMDIFYNKKINIKKEIEGDAYVVSFTIPYVTKEEGVR